MIVVERWSSYSASKFSIPFTFLHEWLLKVFHKSFWFYLIFLHPDLFLFRQLKLTNLILVSKFLFKIQKSFVDVSPYSYQSHFDRFLIPSVIWSYVESSFCRYYMPECYLPYLSSLSPFSSLSLLVSSLSFSKSPKISPFYDHNFTKKKPEFHFLFALFKTDLKVLPMDWLLSLFWEESRIDLLPKSTKSKSLNGKKR